MDTSAKLILNKFIASVNIVYDDKAKCYRTVTKDKIENPVAYVTASFVNKFGRQPKNNEKAYFQSMLCLPFDFDEVPYMVYFKEIESKQKPEEIRNLDDCYANYLKSLKLNNSSKQCIYITGKSGSGKSTLANILAEKFYPKEEICESAGGDNPFDNYDGQKCLIINDIRDSIMRYNDLLKMLDNNITSDIGARYHNKNLARCELIIMTSVVSPTEMYQGITEERYQLYRRIELMKLSDDGILSKFEYDKKSDVYRKAKEWNYMPKLEKYWSEHKPVKKIDIDSLFGEEDVTAEVEEVIEHEYTEDEIPF